MSSMRDFFTDREQWAEDHGYIFYRCPVCGKRFATDGDPAGACCAVREDESEDE